MRKVCKGAGAELPLLKCGCWQDTGRYRDGLSHTHLRFPGKSVTTGSVFTGTPGQPAPC